MEERRMKEKIKRCWKGETAQERRKPSNLSLDDTLLNKDTQ